MDARSAWQKLKRRRIGVPLALFAALWAFYEFEPLRHRDLAYEAPPRCTGQDAGPAHPGSYATNWEGPVFVIQATEYPNCAEQVERVSAHVVGERVLLRIRYHSPTGESYACDCRTKTTVRIGSLDKRNYRVVRIP